MTYDTKNRIDSLDQQNLIRLYKFAKIVIDSKKPNANQTAQLVEILGYIENRLNYNNIKILNTKLSESEFNQARNIYQNMGISNHKYDEQEHKSSFIEGVIGLGGFILFIIVIAIIKGAFDIVINLWNSGVLKVLLGLSVLGGGVYLGYKKGIFGRTKEKEYEVNEKIKEQSYENSNSKSKENSKNDSIIKKGIKNLTIFSSAIAVLGTGMAHLNKHTKVLEDTPLENFGKDCRIVYELASRFIREKSYDLSNDYSEFENMGYMDYISPDIANNWYNLDYQNGDYCLFIKGNYTWPVLSQYCYGNYKFADHLRIYNYRFNKMDEVLHPGDVILVPNIDKLEEFISEKRLVRKR